MYSACRPRLSTVEVINGCSSSIQDAEFKLKVKTAVPDFVKNASIFEQLAANAPLDHSSVKVFLPVGLTRNELHWLYKVRLANSTIKAYALYEELVNKATGQLCVYCNISPAATLDHVVPKSVVAELAIEPLNLVPSCMRCNHKLGDYFGDQTENSLFHPYFLPDLGRWLFATLHGGAPGEPGVIRFSTGFESSQDHSMAMRIRFQFELLCLAELYGISSSGGEVVVAAKACSRFFQFGGSPVVRAYLGETAQELFDIHPNHWKGAVYEALSQSDWFCEGGFNESLSSQQHINGPH